MRHNLVFYRVHQKSRCPNQNGSTTGFSLSTPAFSSGRASYGISPPAMSYLCLLAFEARASRRSWRICWHLFNVWFSVSALTFTKQSFITYCDLITAAKILHSYKTWKKKGWNHSLHTTFLDLGQNKDRTPWHFNENTYPFTFIVGILL